MKKIILILTSIFIMLFLLTSCDANQIEVVYDLDEHIIDVSVPVSALAPNYKKIVEQTSYTIVEVKDDIGTIKINAQNISLTEMEQQIRTIKDEMKLLLPGYTQEIEQLSIGLARDYFGTSIAGTTYYHYTLTTEQPNQLDIVFKSKNSFAVDAQTATKNSDGVYVLNFSTSTSSTPSAHELEYANINVRDVTITFKIDSATPQMSYKAYHQHTDINALRAEIESLGMKVEFIDSQQVVFYEKYDTVDDFNALISARLYAMFGMVTTVEYKHSSFFTADGKFDLKVYSKNPDTNIYITVESADNTQFKINIDDKTQEIVQKTFNIDAETGLNIQASYSNVRWFQSLTSMLAIFAIVAALALMIYLAKRK